MNGTEEETLQQARARAEKAEHAVQALRQTLLGVPHGTGDHTDLCRMQNEGVPPMDERNCHCHVGRVRAAIRTWHI